MIFVFSLIFGVLAVRSFAQQTPNWNNVSLQTHHNVLKFFDRTTGKNYAYTECIGTLTELWALGKLGKDLKKPYPED